jgi:hypothetical protein
MITGKPERRDRHRWPATGAAILLIALCAELLPLQAEVFPTLQFYFVSAEPKPLWRHFSSNAFLNLGYIPPRADLSVSRIRAAHVEQTLQRSTVVHRDGSREVTEEVEPNLVIELLTSDAKALRELTAAHMGERVLIMCGDEALAAPVVRIIIEEPSIAVRLAAGLQPDKVVEKLQKLQDHQP